MPVHRGKPYPTRPGGFPGFALVSRGGFGPGGHLVNHVSYRSMTL